MIKNMRVAFVTGITGQDGSYLCELLLEKAYVVYGVIRRSSSINTSRIDHVYDHERLRLRYGDLTDSSSLNDIFCEIRDAHPGMERLEVYNLGAMTHVKVSFDMPEYTADVDALGTLRLLGAIRLSGMSSITRFYQASTSELFGKVQEIPQRETTPFYPQSPYAVAKHYSYWMTKLHREAYGMFACNGILFNHESPRRGHTFVTRKITRGLCKILNGKDTEIRMGNLNALRDWGHAKDYVMGMWMMLQVDKADDYVLATNTQHSVRDFIEKAFSLRDITIQWEGVGVDEVGRDSQTGKVLIRVDPKYFRPAEVDTLLGDFSKAKQELGWEPRVTFNDLVSEMVNNDCQRN